MISITSPCANLAATGVGTADGVALSRPGWEVFGGAGDALAAA
jgi:hypothetical protein